MQVVVTGARGKVGAAATRRLLETGHVVRAVDLGPPVHERGLPGEPDYLQADLRSAGAAYAAVTDADAVVHAAALPDPLHHPPDEVFATNLLATFNVLEAAIRLGVPRFVYLSSEAVPGYIFPPGSALPDYLPVDEEHPVRPVDPYSLAKHFGEQLMDAAVRRSRIRCISLRPSWVQWAGNYERNLGPQVRDPGIWSDNAWSYVDADDLAEAIRLSVESELAGHEVLYIAAADNATGRPLAELANAAYGDRVPLRPVAREDASGLSCDKAARLLGWTPTRSWRDHLDEDGRSLR
jgi:UDP-glucose 4-epimerase